MKRILFVVFSLLAAHHSLTAQKEIIDATTQFIVAKKFNTANHYIDSVIRKNPKSVDALMMKGNVILNYALDTAKPMKFVAGKNRAVMPSAARETVPLVGFATVKTRFESLPVIPRRSVKFVAFTLPKLCGAPRKFR